MAVSAWVRTICKRALTSHIPRVQTSRHGGVAGAFDDGPPVRKQSHLIRLRPELQNKIIVPHCAVRLQALAHLGEIDGAMAFMNLHRVAAAQRDVGASLAGEMREVSLATCPAIGSRFVGRQFRALIVPDVE